MKQFVSLLIILLSISCANNMSMEKMEHMETNDIVSEEAEAISFDELENAYSILISEKLQDYIDKKALARQHPDFKINEKETPLFASEEVKEIQQIKFIEQPRILSDSITKIVTEVYFDTTEIDTIISYIKTSTTIIDGVPFKTSKATFEKLQRSKSVD